MKSFLAVFSIVCMIAGGLGLIASVPAESLPLAASSLGGILLAGILWALTDVSRQIEARFPCMTRTGDPAETASPHALTADQKVEAADLRLRRIGMIAICLLVLAMCAGVLHFR